MDTSPSASSSFFKQRKNVILVLSVVFGVILLSTCVILGVGYKYDWFGTGGGGGGGGGVPEPDGHKPKSPEEIVRQKLVDHFNLPAPEEKSKINELKTNLLRENVSKEVLTKEIESFKISQGLTRSERGILYDIEDAYKCAPSVSEMIERFLNEDKRNVTRADYLVPFLKTRKSVPEIKAGVEEYRKKPWTSDPAIQNFLKIVADETIVPTSSTTTTTSQVPQQPTGTGGQASTSGKPSTGAPSTPPATGSQQPPPSGTGTGPSAAGSGPGQKLSLGDLDKIRVDITKKKRDLFDKYLKQLRSGKNDLFNGLKDLLTYCSKDKLTNDRINFVSLVLACLDPAVCKPEFFTKPGSKEIISASLQFIDVLASGAATGDEGLNAAAVELLFSEAEKASFVTVLDGLRNVLLPKLIYETPSTATVTKTGTGTLTGKGAGAATSGLSSASRAAAAKIVEDMSDQIQVFLSDATAEGFEELVRSLQGMNATHVGVVQAVSRIVNLKLGLSNEQNDFLNKLPSRFLGAAPSGTGAGALTPPSGQGGSAQTPPVKKLIAIASDLKEILTNELLEGKAKDVKEFIDSINEQSEPKTILDAIALYKDNDLEVFNEASRKFLDKLAETSKESLGKLGFLAQNPGSEFVFEAPVVNFTPKIVQANPIDSIKVEYAEAVGSLVLAEKKKEVFKEDKLDIDGVTNVINEIDNNGYYIAFHRAFDKLFELRKAQAVVGRQELDSSKSDPSKFQSDFGSPLFASLLFILRHNFHSIMEDNKSGILKLALDHFKDFESLWICDKNNFFAIRKHILDVTNAIEKNEESKPYIVDSLAFIQDFRTFWNEYLLKDIPVNPISNAIYQYSNELFGILSIIYSKLQKGPIDVPSQVYNRTPPSPQEPTSAGKSAGGETVPPQGSTSTEKPAGGEIVQPTQPPKTDDTTKPSTESPASQDFESLFNAVDVSSFEEDEKKAMEKLKESLKESAKTLNSEIQIELVPFLSDTGKPNITKLIIDIKDEKNLDENFHNALVSLYNFKKVRIESFLKKEFKTKEELDILSHRFLVLSYVLRFIINFNLRYVAATYGGVSVSIMDEILTKGTISEHIDEDISSFWQTETDKLDKIRNLLKEAIEFRNDYVAFLLKAKGKVKSLDMASLLNIKQVEMPFGGINSLLKLCPKPAEPPAKTEEPVVPPGSKPP